MGLLAVLNLPQPKSWLMPNAAGGAPSAPSSSAPGSRRAEAAPGVGRDGAASEETDELSKVNVRTAAPVEASGDAPVEANADASSPPTEESAPEEGDAEAPVRAAVDGKAASGSASAPPPVSVQVSEDGTSVTYKKTADGEAIAVKDEVTQPVFKETFMVGPVPCVTKGDLSLAFEGEVSRSGKSAGLKVQLTAGGSFSIGVGVAKGCVTVGPLGTAKLTCSQGVAVTYSEADGVAADAFVCEVKATGSVGIEASIDKGPKIKAEAKLVEWQLLIVHVAGFAHGKFSKGIRVEPGKDLRRLIAQLQNAGPAIADAVEKYAPEPVKKAAEDGAKWVAESDEAKEIGDGTGVVLDKVKEKTGVDVGSGAEKVVQFLVDPGGETSTETTERIQRENEAFNASHGEFQEVMARSGLQTEFNSSLYRSAEDYNKIVDTFHAGGEWRPMVDALVAKCRKKKEAYLAEQAAKKKREQDEAAAKAAAELARRVKESEAAMNAALTAANMLGNPLNNRTQGQPGSKARKYWETGMNKYWSPGSAARLKCASLQGEAKIAKAQEATALLVKARAVFQEGTRFLE
jgi:hypothetical protein